jgi:hypothetical protein
MRAVFLKERILIKYKNVNTKGTVKIIIAFEAPNQKPKEKIIIINLLILVLIWF